ncbi:hypothetical protein BB560_001660 [Smittium megazygosporum]|uniref:Methionyl-tRNA formyltransferase, mitochondrial n=1 Tax=Smittium megazygosporum TaxID=133381 RepID=A0A2T9ZH08_9FUNG|nr:hypothetical protein BB560_001660 [Smittium megazygosporum]
MFFGSDHFSVKTFEHLLKYKEKSNTLLDNVCVVTPPPKLNGRGLKVYAEAPLSVFAEQEGVPVFNTGYKSLTGWNIPSVIKDGSETKFDLAVVSSFGYFIPKRIIDKFSSGVINIHPSLLPKYRGASPIQYTILNNDKIGGVSIQKIHPKVMDAGDILAQRTIEIPKNIFRVELENMLADLGGKLLIDTLQNYSGYQKSAIEQDSSKALYASKIEKSFSKINWEKDTSSKIYDKHRAFGDRIPVRASFLHYSPPRNIQFMEIEYNHELSSSTLDFPPGTILFKGKNPDYLVVVCAEGTSIIVKRVKVDEKSEISAHEFVNGYHLKSNSKIFN